MPHFLEKDYKVLHTELQKGFDKLVQQLSALGSS